MRSAIVQKNNFFFFVLVVDGQIAVQFKNLLQVMKLPNKSFLQLFYENVLLLSLLTNILCLTLSH